MLKKFSVLLLAVHAVCNNGWYYGYQGVIVHYTAIATQNAYHSDYAMAIGGSVSSSTNLPN